MTAEDTGAPRAGADPERHRAAARARALAFEMVAWPSETGTADEAAFPRRLADLLRGWPYFRDHPDAVVVLESHGEPRTGAVLALVRGTGRSCVALSGHFDTVTTENYGALAPLACDPVPLAGALVEELLAGRRNDDEERALDDLREGSFIPGRGMLDMKSGLAAGLACLERFARQDERVGNMLFIAVPDEENRSRGMRAVRDALPDLVRRWDLRIAAGINLDATSDLGDGSDGRAIYLGTVGKVLPFAFVIGRPTHAGYPLEGVSAHMIAGEIFRSVELDPDLCESVAGEVSPPPVCLEAKDLRVHYDVTMPGETWLAFNWLTFERGPCEVLALFRDRVGLALDEALDRIADRAARYYRAMGARPPDRREGRVLTFDELRREAGRVGGPDATRRFEALERSLDGEENPLLVSRTLVARLVADAGIVGPAVVVGLGSLYYPPTRVEAGDPGHERLRGIVTAAAARIGAVHGTSVRTRAFFGGICDMSFFGHRPDAADASVVRAQTPSLAHVDRAPPDALSFPCVNIGPWGREYHQKLERVHAPYAFDVLPDLVHDIARAILAGDSRERPVTGLE
ncbi:MAG: M20/M25/M40 family metallo-hydrolase [Microvirga sp.]